MSAEQDTFPPFPVQEGVEFRHIPGHSCYAANSLGEIWSCRAAGGAGKLRPIWHKLTSRLPSNGGCKVVEIGRKLKIVAYKLIALSFLGERRADQVVRFKNRDLHDDRPANLEYATRDELLAPSHLSELPRIPGIELRHIPDFAGYAAADNGQVWTCLCRNWRTPGPTNRWQTLAPLFDDKGYVHVALRRDGKTLRRPIHRLVLLSFVGPCPAGLECCHNNGIRTDNRLANLRWDTPTANQKDRVEHGTTKQGEQCSWAKFTESDVREIRKAAAAGERVVDIAARYKTSSSRISSICLRYTWKHVVGEDSGNSAELPPSVTNGRFPLLSWRRSDQRAAATARVATFRWSVRQAVPADQAPGQRDRIPTDRARR